MSLPAVRRIQKRYPLAKITWIISRPAYDMLEWVDDIEFIVIEKPRSLGDYWSFYAKMRGRHFDILLAMQASLRANFLYPLISARRKIGYDKQRAKDGHSFFINERIPPGNEHTLEGFLKFAAAIGANANTVDWEIPIPIQAKEFAARLLPEKRPILMVNAAASKAERCWPVNHLITVLKFAKQQWDCEIVLIGGPGAFDRNLADQIIHKVPAIDCVGKTKPLQLLAMIQLADVVLCPDTGPSHMAVAVGTPVIALHAVTSPEVSGPYLYRHLAVDYYPQAVESILQIPFEKNVWGTHVHSERSMSLIPVESVVRKLSQVMDAVQNQYDDERISTHNS